ncbi:MAG: hypothetical protein QM536_07135 [Chitinophagaceae bacterium]|nr:hypothetical protein [Chitinophagaceae bacterium]
MNTLYSLNKYLFFILILLNSCNDVRTKHSTILSSNKKLTLIHKEQDKIILGLHPSQKDTSMFFFIPAGNFFFFHNDKLIHALSVPNPLVDTVHLSTFYFPLTIYSTNASFEEINFKTSQENITKREKKRTTTHLQNIFSYYLYVYIILLPFLLLLFSKNREDLPASFSIKNTKESFHALSNSMFIILLQILLSITIGFFLLVISLLDKNQNEMETILINWLNYSKYTFLFFVIRQSIFLGNGFLLHNKTIKLLLPQYVKMNFMMSLFVILLIFLFFYVSPSFLFFLKKNIVLALFVWGVAESIFLYFLQKNEDILTKMELLYCLLSIEILPLLFLSKELQIFTH